MTERTMRERLARSDDPELWDYAGDRDWNGARLRMLARVDRFLAELETPTEGMIEAYRKGLRLYITSFPAEEREGRWGRGRKRRGSYCYEIPENEKALARFVAMVRAIRDGK